MEKGLKFTKLMCIINSRIMSVRFRDKGRPLSHSHYENVIPFNYDMRSYEEGIKMNRKLKSTLSALLAITMMLSLGTAAAFAEGTGEQGQPVVCTGSAEVTDCAAETHIEGCPKYVSAKTPAEGAEEKEQPAVCTGSAEAAECAAETHVEGCLKYVSTDAAGEGESSEADAQKAAVQARIEALPEKDAFDAMSEEDKNGVAVEYAAIMEELYKLCEAEGIEDGDIEKLEGIDLGKLIALSDAINEYTTAPLTDPAAWIGTTGYETLKEAVSAAVSGDTITLGEGNYTLYGISREVRQRGRA